MKHIKSIVFIIILQLTVVCFNKLSAQVIAIEGWETAAVPSFGTVLPAGTVSGVGSSGTNVATTLTFARVSAFTFPSISAHTGTWALKINTDAAASLNSNLYVSSVLNFQETCANSQMTFSFWMYRTGTDANADRVRILVNTAPNLTGATLLTTVNRSRALSPTITYGADGWYNYEVVIPATYNGATNYLMIDAIDASPVASGNIYIDDLQFYHSNGNASNTTGAVANAGTNVSFCSGGNSTIGSITIPNTSYAWAPATGLSSTTVSNPTVTLGTAGVTNYTVTATAAGCPAKTSTVNVTVSGTTAPAITSANSTNICSGTALAFPFTASGTPTGYIWLASNNAITTGESFVNTINSATLNDVITSASSQVVTYSVSAYNASCPAGTNPIQIFSVNVNIAPSGSAPSNVALCPGGTAVFSTAASGGGTYTYQWQQNSVNIGGATSSSYSLPGVTTGMNGNTYRCIISNGCTPNATTTAAVLTVTVPTVSLTGVSPACYAGTGTITATGVGISTYLWDTGATTSVINPTAGTYACTVTSVSGCTASATYVLTQPAYFGGFTSGPSIICSGATCNVTLNGTGGTPPYSYNWIATNNANITGESLTNQTSSTLNNTLINTSAATQNALYSFSVTDATGCVQSYGFVFVVTNSVITIAAPSNTTVCQTDVATFVTNAVGGSGSFSYQWQEDNGGGFANITNGGVYSGATAATLSITAPPTSMNTYRYKCIINDGCSSSASGVAILFVTAAFTYTYSDGFQPVTSNVGRCASKQEILRLRIDMTVGSCPSTATVTSLDWTASGTEADIKKAYIYYTGSNPNFVSTNLFATIPVVVSGNMVTAGSQVLATGTNYFWIVYDIDPAGTGTYVDATCSFFTTIGGSNPGSHFISTSNPVGFRSISTCISPGGVTAGLTYWLKSNDGSNLNSSTHDAPINIWSSSFSNVSDLTQPTSTKRPIFKDYPYDTTFNFNPYLTFDGNDDILQNTSINDLLKNDGLALLVSARSITVSPNNRTSFGFQAPDALGGYGYQIMPENELRYINSLGTAASFNVSGFTDPDSDFIMAKMTTIAGNSSGTPDIADFMRNDDVFQSAGSNAPVVEFGLTIGGSGDGGSYSRGNSKIAEVITYSEYLPKADLDKVETYAAIKYGIHLNKDYVSSAGTAIWDYAADPTYNHDIAGIGRDDKSGLNQKQTQSVNIDEMLTIGLDSIENSNKNNTAVFANDNSFLVWGNNNQYARSDYSTIIPAAAPYLPAGIQGRLRRVWKLQGTNFGTSGTFKSGDPGNNQQNGTMAATTIEVAFDDYLLLNVLPTSNLRLLIDDDGVDFSNAIIKGPGKTKGGATASGSRVSFEGVDVGPGKNFITLATTNVAATILPIELINFKAICENNMANISWNTSSETNVKHFTIEQSVDGINYSVAKIISPKGQNNSGANYNITCNIIPSKINYFRLKETSNNDIIYNFDPVSISNNCDDSKLSAFISPNPISNSVGELTIRFNSEIQSTCDLKVINSIGNTIYQTTYKSNDAYNSLKLQVKNLETGIYFLEIKNNKGSYRFKFMVVE